MVVSVRLTVALPWCRPVLAVWVVACICCLFSAEEWAPGFRMASWGCRGAS